MISEIDLIYIVQKNDTAIYSPLVSGFIGLCGVLLGYWLKEKNENDQEEFRVLLATKDLLDANPIDRDAINDFYKKMRFDLRARRLDTYELVVSALVNAKEDKIDPGEKDKIASRINTLNKKRFISRVKSKINKVQ